MGVRLARLRDQVGPSATAEPVAAPREREGQPVTGTVEEPHDSLVETAQEVSVQPDVSAILIPDAATAVAVPPVPTRTRLWHALMRVHKPLMFIDYYRQAGRLVKHRSVQAVHAHDLNTLPVAAAVARRHGARLVYDSHELYTEISTLSERERRVWRLVERLLISRADQVITVCGSIAGELQQRYQIPPPLVLLNCPHRPPVVTAERDTMLLRERAGLVESSEPIVLYQGGFAAHRGLENLVTAAREFERGVLVLMGWGVLADELARLIGSLGLGERVVMIDPVPQSTLLSYTRGAEVGVIPYEAVGLNNYYSTPNKLFEYMAAGVPIVGSRFPELERFIDGLGTGRTFDPSSNPDLVAAVNYVLADDDRRAGMRERALRASIELSWESEAEKLLSLYGVAPVKAARPSQP